MWKCQLIISLCFQSVINFALFQLFFSSFEASVLLLNQSLFFDTEDSSQLYTYAVDEKQRNIFVEGKEKLFKLTYDLTLQETIHYGQIFSNHSCGFEESKIEYDVLRNKNKLLLIDYANDILLSCGTLNFGLCYRHFLSNLSNYVVVNGYSAAASHIASCRNSSVGVVGPGPDGRNVFYFARTLDNDLPYNLQQSVSSKIWNGEQNGFELVANVSGKVFQVSSISVFEAYFHSYKVNYIYGFSYNGFTYFLTVQPQSTSTKREEMRLARVCQNDTAYYSYAELSLQCKRSKYLPYAAQLTKVAKDFNAAYDLHHTKDNYVLFVLTASKYQPSKFKLCFYDMQVIEQSFYSGIEACNSDTIGTTGLDYISGPDHLHCDKSSTSQPVTSCPTFYNPNFIHHIHVSKQVDGNLTYTDAITLVTGSKIRSFHVFVFNSKFTVAVAGTESGHLSLYHIGANKHQLLKKVISAKIGNKSISEITAVDDGNLLFLNNFFTLHQVVTSSFCKLLKTCNRCLQFQFIECGYCISSLGCTSKFDCDKSWSNTSCPTSVANFSPTSGPFEGNTIVTFHGEGLGHTTPNLNFPTNRSILFANNSKCNVVSPENYSTVACKTVPIQSHTQIIKSDIIIIVNAVQPAADLYVESYSINGKVILEKKFSFVHVAVGNFTPMYGPKSGSTRLEIKGLNLDSGSSISVSVATFPCTNISRTKTSLFCYTSKFKKALTTTVSGKVVVRIDGAERNASGMYTYMKNPDVRTKQINSLRSGGTEVSISGSNFQSVYKPFANVLLGDAVTKVLCRVESDKKMTFISPNLLNQTENSGNIEIIMDGTKQLAIYEVFRDPMFDSIDEATLQFGKGGNIQLRFTGTNLFRGCKLRDYKVFLKDSLQCPSDLKSRDESLICKISSQDLPKYGYSFNITVQIGQNVNIWLGVLNVAVPVSYDVIIGVVCAVIVVALAVFVFCVYYHRRKKSATDDIPAVTFATAQNDNLYHNGQGNEATPLIPQTTPHSISDQLSAEILQEMSSVLISSSRLKANTDDIIGKGHFGTVYHGEFVESESEHDGSRPVKKVAIKTLSRIEDMDSVEAFLREGLMMSNFKHENVLTLIGICIADNRSPMVILPFMKHGDLLQFIRNPDNSPTVKDLIGFGLQACRGMEYLASHRFVHRDLAARNCMLDEVYSVKVADFGLARDIYEKEYYKPHTGHAGRMPVKWMALESLQQQKFTSKTDVWSFGILLWELLTRGVTPYPDVDAFDVVNYILEGRRLRQPRFCPDELFNLMLSCWHPAPDSRPTFKMLVYKIEFIHNEFHGIHYPGLDVSYVNIDVNPYPSLMIRSSESRSTGASDVFTPGLSADDETTPKSFSLPASRTARVGTDDTGYLIPQESTKRSAESQSSPNRFSPLKLPSTNDEEITNPKQLHETSGSRYTKSPTLASNLENATYCETSSLDMPIQL